MRRIRSRAGFTLAEVLAAGGLIAVILAMTAVVMVAAVNGFARGAKQDAARQLGLSVYNFYRDLLVSSREIAVGTGGGARSLGVADGKVLYSAEGGESEPLYPDAMYAGLSVRVTVFDDGGALGLRVDVSDGDVPVYFKQSAFKLLTLERAGGAVQWPGGERRAENPVIYFY